MKLNYTYILNIGIIALVIISMFVNIFSEDLHEMYIGFRHHRRTPEICDSVEDTHTFVDNFNREDTNNICNGWITWDITKIRDNTLILARNSYRVAQIMRHTGNLKHFNLSFDLRMQESNVNMVLDFNKNFEFGSYSGSYIFFGTPNHWSNIEVIDKGQFDHIEYEPLHTPKWYHVKIKYSIPHFNMTINSFDGTHNISVNVPVGHNPGEYMAFKVAQKHNQKYGFVYMDNIRLEK